MDKNCDKENIKAKTKIPLPRAPLPPIPHHLLKKVADREPLNTLVGPNGHHLNVPQRFDSIAQCLAVPSNSRTKNSNSPSPFKMDTRFVTMQRGCEDTVTQLRAYKTDSRRIQESVISISSDEEDEQLQVTCILNKNKPMTTPGPGLHTLEPAKNMKLSVKKPHSRELQEITPSADSVKTNEVRRRLSFKDTIGEIIKSPRFLQESYMECLDTEEIMSHLLDIETRAADVPRVNNEARACHINWLMKINGFVGNPATIQTAVWYLDSILTIRKVEQENLELVAATAYWIASKIQGPVIPASKLVEYSDPAVTTASLVEAEKIMIAALKFPRQPVIPQDYIGYFAWKCDKKKHGEIEVAATFLCLCGIMVNKSLCQLYPSTIAAASIRNALLLMNKKDLMPRLQECAEFVAVEKKDPEIWNTCTILRHAVRAVAATDYSYKCIFQQYGFPPEHIAQAVVNAANKLAVSDIVPQSICEQKMMYLASLPE